MPVPRSYSFQNNFATFTGNAVGSDLGSARRGVFTIADHHAADVHHDDPGRRNVVPRDDRQPVGRSCGSRPVRLPVHRFVVRHQDAARPECGRRLEESVTIANPAAGTWEVRGRRLRGPGGIDDVQLRRHLRQPGAGHGRGHRSGRRASGGSSWTAPGSVTAGAVPETGRVLLGTVNVLTDGGFSVGSADVVVEHVTP